MDLTNEMVSVIKTYPWQCMDCKTCVECMDPYDEVLHVVLNAEARSWGWGGGVRATCEILIIAPPKKIWIPPEKILDYHLCLPLESLSLC